MVAKYLASMEDWDMFMLHKGYADAPDICSMTRSEHARAVRSWLLEHEFHERTCKMTRTPCGAWKCSHCGTVESHNIEPFDVYPYPHCPHCGAKVVNKMETYTLTQDMILVLWAEDDDGWACKLSRYYNEYQNKWYTEVAVMDAECNEVHHSRTTNVPMTTEAGLRQIALARGSTGVVE